LLKIGNHGKLMNTVFNILLSWHVQNFLTGQLPASKRHLWSHQEIVYFCMQRQSKIFFWTLMHGIIDHHSNKLSLLQITNVGLSGVTWLYYMFWLLYSVKRYHSAKFFKKKGKAIPVIGHGDLQHCGTSKVPCFLDGSQLPVRCQSCFTLQEDSGAHFC
jgi:hypothetical protein